MDVIRKDIKTCLSCMEEHDVTTVIVPEESTFKGKRVAYQAIYEYCDYSEEFSANEDLLKLNGLAMKDAYRKMEGLLTSEQIIAIRDRYRISQKDFSQVLDWGMATITRYENHQVQDRAHDDILRKINDDPKWFLEMIDRAKDSISEKAYHEYRHNALELYKSKKNQYLVDHINSIYASFENNEKTGGVPLNLNKAVEMINYLASKVSSLHKVKLMKMLWYSDGLNYKRFGKSISGLAYQTFPMGAVPLGYEQLVLLDGVCFEEVRYDASIGYKFKPVDGFKVQVLSESELDVIDHVIKELGNYNATEIVKRMHEEDAFKLTDSNCIIDYSFAEHLSLN